MISEYKDLIGIVVTVSAGSFAFIKWIDSRNRELKERRYKTYMDLICVISGKRPDSSTPNFSEQIAAVWLLTEYGEYRELTQKIFSDGYIEELGTPQWAKYIAPHIQKMLSQTKPGSVCKWFSCARKTTLNLLRG